MNIGTDITAYYDCFNILRVLKLNKLKSNICCK